MPNNMHLPTLDTFKYYLRVPQAGTHMLPFQDAVIAHGSAYDIYYFAKNIKGANIKKLQDATCKTHDIRHIFNFAKYIKGADLEVLGEVIRKSKNRAYIALAIAELGLSASMKTKLKKQLTLAILS